jgi:hypothetical protein
MRRSARSGRNFPYEYQGTRPSAGCCPSPPEPSSPVSAPPPSRPAPGTPEPRRTLDRVEPEQPTGPRTSRSCRTPRSTERRDGNRYSAGTVRNPEEPGPVRPPPDPRQRSARGPARPRAGTPGPHSHREPAQHDDTTTDQAPQGSGPGRTAHTPSSARAGTPSGQRPGEHRQRRCLRRALPPRWGKGRAASRGSSREGEEWVGSGHLSGRSPQGLPDAGRHVKAKGVP